MGIRSRLLFALAETKTEPPWPMLKIRLPIYKGRDGISGENAIVEKARIFEIRYNTVSSDAESSAAM